MRCLSQYVHGNLLQQPQGTNTHAKNHEFKDSWVAQCHAVGSAQHQPKKPRSADHVCKLYFLRALFSHQTLVCELGDGTWVTAK